MYFKPCNDDSLKNSLNIFATCWIAKTLSAEHSTEEVSLIDWKSIKRPVRVLNITRCSRSHALWIIYHVHNMTNWWLSNIKEPTQSIELHYSSKSWLILTTKWPWLVRFKAHLDDSFKLPRSKLIKTTNLLATRRATWRSNSHKHVINTVASENLRRRKWFNNHTFHSFSDTYCLEFCPKYSNIQ